MPDPEPAEVDDEGVLDASDTLESDDVTADPLDTGVIPPDRWSAGMRFGSTEAEEREGESLDQLLSEEEPDVDPYRENATEDSEDSEASTASTAMRSLTRGRAAWSPRTRARIPTRNPTWSPRTSASTVEPQEPRKPPCT